MPSIAQPKLRCRLLSSAFALAVLGAACAQAADEPAAEPKTKLPLKSVVMFNSGVGFFEHRAEVEGDAAVDLRFNVEDINDLLKSMVLQDLGGGRISPVTYTSKDPITKTLKTFAIDLTDNPTLAQILGQVRGETVEVEAPEKTTGTIVGLEKRKRRASGDDDTIIEIDVMNLLTESGLKSIPLEQISSIRFANVKLNQEFGQALALLASGHSTDKKTVTLRFSGDGKRAVRVGYIQEAPIWKTSYRLVLNEKESPLLQGWAIVENTTEEDWDNVRLTLVSGRPISFVMDLYEPLYLQRPVVEPELFASLRPQQYGQDLAQSEQRFRGAAGGAAPPMRKARSGQLAAAEPAAPAPTAEGMEAHSAAADAGFVVGNVEPAAQAGEVGELFQYAIDEPVTLQRQKSAMLPIVNSPVEAEKVSIYNVNVQPKHPLNGLKLTNKTDLHLMQGPITVFDGGAYAGDAQIEDLAPGGERLISYALDLEVEVSQEQKSHPEEITGVKIVKGVLEAQRKFRRSVEYTIKNSAGQPRKVLIEHPFDPNWTLVEPAKPAEKTRDRYRFEVTAEPGKPATLTVVEEMVNTQHLAVLDLDLGAIHYYLTGAKVKDEVKQALREVVAKRQKIESVVNQRQNIEKQVAAIDQDQTRIRENMGKIGQNTELYNRYLKKLNSQEDELEKSRGQIEDLTVEEQKLRRELEDYLSNLTLE
jgi:hypothetical protein